MERALPPEQGWSSLPADLLETILKRLPWSSHPSVAATCNHWRSVVPPFYPAWLSPVLFHSVDVGTSTIRYYSPYFHKNFDLPIVDVNTVTGVIHDLYPSSSERTEFDFVIYDGDGRRMFGIDALSTLNIARANQNDEGRWYRWKFAELNPNYDPTFAASPVTNPVLHCGLLYLLATDGRLAVHDDKRREEGLKILDKPEGFGFEWDDDCYLFESDEGDLMVVLIGCRGSPVRLVRLNEQSMEWEEVVSLEGRALFTGALTTMMVKSDVEWMKNKIFVPGLYHWPETIAADLVDRQGELLNPYAVGTQSLCLS
ncbi:hypothetical protein PR202_gb22735 [Eleusine coracana subsp. coracana]|uniref:F-box domain-containing protein n=1 Tax=Eleusine coracana subsp. coracana TaxID=191504 RepID=A0AAV5FIL7_ELECO|nr:hypothetical protein PR202_gb22735 [Eleusine coracana subsp. coracana]